jgi:beta-ribofuranosylaminobenzene 5'-phosphate synthase
LPAAQIRVVTAPPEHVGLGVGTQLCLAVARAVFLLAGTRDLAVDDLARWTGRGRRSGIGLHGFDQGGLIVDGGRRNDFDIPPLLARLPFPEEWSILIVRPPSESGLHGPDENRAFATLPPITQIVTDSLCRLVLLEILPAVRERDLPAFGAALGELQTHVGACFAPAQGGIYATAQASRMVAELGNLGFVGAGQSSWGPTLYAFSSLPEHELAALAELLRQQFGLDHKSVFLTRGANHGARFSFDG